MNERTNIHTVWSGAPSKQIALLLNEWMPIFLKGTVDCWASANEWGPELAKQLDESDGGVICLLTENRSDDWIHFQAGALARSVENGRIYCLCFGFQPANLPGTLGQFPTFVFEKRDFLRFLKQLDDNSGSPLSEKDIEETFDPVWNAFTAEIHAVIGAVLDPDAEAEPISTPANADLPIDQLRILLWFIEHPTGKPTAPQLARDLNIHPDATEIHLNELLDNEYIGSDITVGGDDAKWCIHRDGRTLLRSSGLLK